MQMQRLSEGGQIKTQESLELMNETQSVHYKSMKPFVIVSGGTFAPSGCILPFNATTLLYLLPPQSYHE
jgi:hypothetical protein